MTNQSVLLCINTFSIFEFLACMTYTKRYCFFFFFSFDLNSFSWLWPNFGVIVSKNIQNRENCKCRSLNFCRVWGTENRYVWSERSEGKNSTLVSETTHLREQDAVRACLLNCCPSLCDLTDCIPPRSSVCGLFQARILESVAISSSRRSSWPRDQTHLLCLLNWQADSLPLVLPGKRMQDEELAFYFKNSRRFHMCPDSHFVRPLKHREWFLAFSRIRETNKGTEAGVQAKRLGPGEG